MQLSKFHRRSIPIAVVAAMATAVTPVVAQSGLPSQLSIPQLAGGTLDTDVTSYAIIASNSASVARNGSVTGSVASSLAFDPDAPTIEPGFNTEIERGSTVTGDVVGDRLKLDAQTTITGDRFCNSLMGGGSCLSFTPPALDMPPFGAADVRDDPAAPAQDVFVGTGLTVSLAPGQYGDITVGNKGTVVFEGGVYDVRSLTAVPTAGGQCTFPCRSYLFDARTDLRIEQRFDSELRSVVGPSGTGAGNGLDASDILISASGTSTGLYPAVIEIGRESDVDANLYAPFGTNLVEKDSAVEGGLFGLNVQVDIGSSVVANSAYRNRAPIADDQVVADGTEVRTADVITEVPITLTATDPDGDDLTYRVTVLPTAGTLTEPGGGAVTAGSDLAGDTVLYTPGSDPSAPGFEDSFRFRANDGELDSNEATVEIRGPEDAVDPPGVVGVDAKPNPPDEQVEETVTGSPLTITLVAAAPLAPAPGAIGDLEFSISAQPPSGEGTVSAPVAVANTPVRSATVTYDPQSFGPTDPSAPPAATSFQFTACEAGTSNCDTAVIDVQVGALAPLAPPTVSNVGAQVLEEGVVTLDLAIGSRATGPQGPPLPEDGRGGPQGFAAPRAGGGFLAQAPGQTFSDEGSFLAALGISRTYDFEQPTFPAASAIIGDVDGIDFQGRIGFAVNPPPPSGTQFMRGTGTSAPFDGPGVIDFTGLVSPIDGVGFSTGFGGISSPAPFTRVQVYGPNQVLLHQEFVATNQPAGAYFGYLEDGAEIVELHLQGFQSDLVTPASAQQFGIDDLTIGFVSETRDSTVAWNVADSNGDGAGDESNADEPGFPGAPALISATNNTTGGAGSNGVARVHIEWDISDLAGTIGQAEVTVHTSPGTSGLDTLATMFYVASGDGDGVLTNSDWETAATQVAGVVLPNQTGISEFTFDVTSQLQAAVDAGFDWFVVQGRVVEAPPSTNPGGERGMQIRSQCATCPGANPPELAIAPAALQPDLVVDSLTHDPANPTTEDNIVFTAVVKNIGNAPAGPSTLSHKIGGESPQDPSALFDVPALAPGETFTAVRTLSLIAQNYQNTATADFNDEVSESDENNNTTLDFYTVTDAVEPPLFIGTFSITSLPLLGTLKDSTGAVISAVPYTLPDTTVTYTALSTAQIGQIDQFGFAASNNAGTSSALANVAIVAELLPPDPCILVGRPPGCSPD